MPLYSLPLSLFLKAKTSVTKINDNQYYPSRDPSPPFSVPGILNSTYSYINTTAPYLPLSCFLPRLTGRRGYSVAWIRLSEACPDVIT